MNSTVGIRRNPWVAKHLEGLPVQIRRHYDRQNQHLRDIVSLSFEVDEQDRSTVGIVHPGGVTDVWTWSDSGTKDAEGNTMYSWMLTDTYAEED